MNKAFVTRSTGSWYDLCDVDSNKYIKARLRGIFKQENKRVTNPIAVGDYVMYSFPDAGSEAMIEEILPRNNYIIRKSTHKAEHEHIIASNLDQAVLIVTIDQPRTSLGFIDRFLVSAESYRIPTTIVINKIDLYTSKKNQEALADLIETYTHIGYNVIQTSTTKNIGIEAFNILFEGKKTLVCGHSGVGKSSLVNAIQPELNLRTASISNYANKGKHTTTFAEMFELAPKTYIIDTPGIKELGISEIEDAELSHYFPEMRALLGKCRFHNCQHIHEPDCVVYKAVENGDIPLSRYENYLSILADEDNRR